MTAWTAGHERAASAAAVVQEAQPVRPAATRPHVVAILPRGEAIRNFVHSGTLDAIRADAELTVLSVVPDEASFGELGTRFSRVLPLECPRDRWPVRFLRDVLDMAHGRALWSAAARDRWRLRDAEARTPVRRLKRLGRKAACYPFATRRGVRLLAGLERAASRALCPSDAYMRLFRELKPTLVFNGSHVHSAVAIHAVQAAQWLGIPTAAFVFSWDNLTSQGRVIPEHDHYLVWNEEIRRQLLTLYPQVPADHVFATGTPQFDFHFRPEAHWTREDFCARVGADPARPIVLYSTGMAHHMPGEPAVVEQIADMLRGMPPELGRPQLLVRVYPKDRTGRFEELRARRPDILFPPAQWVSGWLTPTEDDSRLLTNTLRHATVGINIASTVSLELGMFGKPVVNVAYDPPGAEVQTPVGRYYGFDHYRPLVEQEAVRVAWSPAQMRALLEDALRCPDADERQRRAFLQRMFGDTLDGRSGARVADVLLRLAGSRGE